MTVKYQQGGGMPPFVYYRPALVTLPSGTVAGYDSATAVSSSSKSYELSNKDLLKALDKIDGLPSDMAALKDNLVTALGTPSSLFGSSGLFGSTGQLATQYANTLVGIKMANYSKKSYDEIKKRLDSNGGLNEVAVTDTGGVIVKDKEGNVKPISVDEYLSNKGNYETLTNSNLLYMRAWDSKFANNDKLMLIAGAGIGLTEINKEIKAALGNLGKEEQSKESYTILQGAEVIKSIYEKTGETKLEGLYKIKNKSSDLAKQVQAALNYVWGMLPENAKAVLKIKAGSEKGAYDMIAGFIASGSTTTSEYSEQYLLDKDGNKPGSNKKSGSGDDLLSKQKQGAASNFINGNGKQEQFTIVNGTKDGIRVTGNSSPLTTNTGKIGGPMSMLTASKGGFGGVLDWNNISIGGKHISEAHMSDLMCTDGTIHSVDFPSTTDESGNIVPNYKLFAQKEAADQEITRLGINPTTDPDKANAIYQKHGLPIKYNSDGNINTDKWTRFGVMNGVALSRAFDDDQSFNSMLKEVGDNDLEGYLKLFNNEAKISGAQQEAGKDIEFDKASWWDKLVGGGQHWYTSHDQMFKGTIFIPIKNDQLAAMYGDSNKTTVAENLEITGREQDNDLEESYNDPGELDE